MKEKKVSIKFIAILLTASILLNSCSSATMIQSSPSGARLNVDGEMVGTTPYYHSDTKIMGSYTRVRLDMDGYEPLTTSFSKDEQADIGAIIGGFFVFVPFLWSMKYKPARVFTLTPIEGPQSEGTPVLGKQEVTTSKADQLRELKKLFDENVLSLEEYEHEKAKILESFSN